jgi:glycerol-1-phosphate dehydrogenase [NAD(P)+]
MPDHETRTRAIDVPTRLEDLPGFAADCPCGRRHEVDLRRVSIRPGALHDLPDAARLAGTGPRTLVVCDRVTRQIAGDRAAELLRRDGRKVATLVLPDGAGGRPHATEEAVVDLEQALRAFDLVVAAGAGTINDIVKLASFRCGLPYIAVGTAPSMNGYASAIAAILRAGVKRTVDCHQPLAVILDLDLLCRAPAELIAAGLGDLESKPTSTADFRLGSLLRGAYHCRVPERVVLDAEARAAEAAPGLRRGDPEAVAALAEALVLSGISMKLAGTSGPASGGEHLISHLWDMTADEEGRVEGWHGAQVGVATVACAALYERLREIDPATIDPVAVAARRPSLAELERGIRERHGQRADEVLAETLAKRLNDAALEAELELLRSDWDRIWAGLDDVLRPAARIREILAAAGAPVTVAGLGLTADHLRRAFTAAREIRGRFTVLDLAFDLGLLESLREEVLDRSGCLG